jgi:beta-methylmalyl-CoA/(S)-malyl-CoA lyase
MTTKRLCRSFQTAPVAVARENSAKYLESGFDRSGFEVPDWLVPDLEDGIAPDMREEGLENTVDLVTEHGDSFPGEVWPRIQWTYADAAKREAGREEIARIVREAGEALSGFVVPKVGRLENVEDAVGVVAEAERDYGYPEGTFEVSPIIETARARSDLREIAAFGADSRLHGLVFGPVDYAAELGGRSIRGEWATWNGLVEALSNETSANGLVGIGGPFDQIFRDRAGVTVYNADAYAENAEREARFGLDGSWSLHPKQTVQANRIHTPSESEVRRDLRATREFLDAKGSGTGAILVDGQMVDEGTFKNYTNTLEEVATIHERHPDQTTVLYDAALLDAVLELHREV